MNIARIAQTLGPIDLKSVQRDPLMRWMIFTPLLMAIVSRWLMPLIIGWVEAVTGFLITPYYAPIMGYALIILNPFLAAALIGFLLLDQRDEGTLAALQVTPLSINGYLIYRLTLPMAAGILGTLLVLPLSGIVPLSFVSYVLLAVGAAPLAPIMALALVVIAQNKVQGFAVMKASGVLLLPPIAAYFIEGSWHFLLALVPTYWPAMMLWTAVESDPAFWFFWVAGIVYQSLLLIFLARRFERIMVR